MKKQAAVRSISKSVVRCTRAALAEPAKKKGRPTPEQVDEHAAEYRRLREWIEAGKLDAERLKGKLVKLAQRYGETPAGAEKSFRLLGLVSQITASFGTSSAIDEAVVEKIRVELAIGGTPSLFDKLFQQRVSHIVSPVAPVVLENCSKKVRNMFARVMKTKAKEPSLKVEKRKK